MIEALAAAVPLAQDWLWAAFVVFVRVGALVSLSPAFGEQSVPVRVRLAVAIAFTLIVLPAVAPQIPPRDDRPSAILPLVLTEALVGLLFGLMVRFFLLALQTAGTLAAQATSLSQLFGAGPGGEPSPAMGHLFIVSGLALAAILGLHVTLASYVILSYDLAPAGTLPGPETVREAGVAEVARSFSLAFMIAAPFVIASVLYNVTLGVMNRAMPQLMVTFIGAPALTAGGLLLLLLAIPMVLSIWSDGLFGFLLVPFGPAP